MALKKSIVWFEEVDKNDVGLVGGKGANLGEMTRAKFPIPYGFIITSAAYFDFIKKNNLEKEIKKALQGLNTNRPDELQLASKTVKKLIVSATLPAPLAKQIVSYYDNLPLKEKKYFSSHLGFFNHVGGKIRSLYNPVAVAVRSSATAEDLPDASFAGQQETFLNIKGEAQLLHKVKECFASLFTERAIFYRHEQKYDHFKVGLAVVVQRLVESDYSGVAFSVDPISRDKNKMIIEAIRGLGEYIVAGRVTPDHYEIDKRSFIITGKQIKYQNLMLLKSHNKNREVRLGVDEGKKQKITDEEIIRLAMVVKDIEKHYFFPQDIEWAIENRKIYITQSRPVTTLGKSNSQGSGDSTRVPILVGSPASPGVGVGPVKVVPTPKQINIVKQGDILVAPQTNPDYVPAMKRAAAIVTEKGGRTSHAAIVSRELGIPAIVGADRATKILKDNMVVTVNGQAGEVYKGKIITKSKIEKLKSRAKKFKTVTKIYVNMAQPSEAERVSKMDADGVGLLRAEFIIADIGVHPKEFIKNKKEDVFINRLTRELMRFTVPFNPRPVIYRATDFKTNEYRNLKGGSLYEPKEENPMLGFRGAYRYITNPDVFNMELSAIKKIWEKGYRNLHLMIPFVRVPWELMKIKEMVEKSGLLNYPDFKLWIMVEVPSAALNLEEFIKVGIDGVSIGTNDLTMMLLGVDRDSEEVAPIYDERTPIVKQVLEYIVKTCHKHGVTASICGQAPSDYEEICELLVKNGITSLSVNSDVIDRTRELVFKIEKELFTKKK